MNHRHSSESSLTAPSRVGEPPLSWRLAATARGVLPPFSGLGGVMPPGIFQPDPGFEVHGVSLTSRAQPPLPKELMLLAVLACSRRAPTSPLASPRTVPWGAPFEDFPSSTAGVASRRPVPSCRHDTRARGVTRYARVAPPTRQPHTSLTTGLRCASLPVARMHRRRPRSPISWGAERQGPPPRASGRPDAPAIDLSADCLRFLGPSHCAVPADATSTAGLPAIAWPPDYGSWSLDACPDRNPRASAVSFPTTPGSRPSASSALALTSVGGSPEASDTAPLGTVTCSSRRSVHFEPTVADALSTSLPHSSPSREGGRCRSSPLHPHPRPPDGGRASCASRRCRRDGATLLGCSVPRRPTLRRRPDGNLSPAPRPLTMALRPRS